MSCACHSSLRRDSGNVANDWVGPLPVPDDVAVLVVEPGVLDQDLGLPSRQGVQLERIEATLGDPRVSPQWEAGEADASCSPHPLDEVVPDIQPTLSRRSSAGTSRRPAMAESSSRIHSTSQSCTFQPSTGPRTTVGGTSTSVSARSGPDVGAQDEDSVADLRRPSERRREEVRGEHRWCRRDAVTDLAQRLDDDVPLVRVTGAGDVPHVLEKDNSRRALLEDPCDVPEERASCLVHAALVARTSRTAGTESPRRGRRAAGRRPGRHRESPW